MTISDEFQPHIEDWVNRKFGRATTDEASEQQRRALAIVARHDRMRIDFSGGYPSCVRFIGDSIAWATINGHEPELVVQSVAEFIAERTTDVEDEEDAET